MYVAVIPASSSSCKIQYQTHNYKTSSRYSMSKVYPILKLEETILVYMYNRISFALKINTIALPL